jgi:hypothetical protein
MRLPEAVSRLAAPFFGSQAEPFSRQRGMSGPWWCLLAFDETLRCVVASLLAYAWCHVSVILATGFALSTLHPDHVRSGAASNLIGNIKMLLELLEASSNNIRFVSWGLGVFNGYAEVAIMVFPAEVFLYPSP